MSKNQHRWKASLDDRIRDVLEHAAKLLEWAWKVDKKDPRSFPVQTWWQFVRLEYELGLGQRAAITLPSPRQPPQRLSDLIAECTIKGAYEDHNEGSYEDALKQAAEGYDEGYSAWRKIMRALDAAYITLHYGIDFAPKPRVHFLHRKLLGIAESEHLRGLTHEGIVEFFDDMCPCGKTHKPDAIRKLRKRWGRRDLRGSDRPPVTGLESM